MSINTEEPMKRFDSGTSEVRLHWKKIREVIGRSSPRVQNEASGITVQHNPAKEDRSKVIARCKIAQSLKPPTYFFFPPPPPVEKTNKWIKTKTSNQILPMQ